MKKFGSGKMHVFPENKNPTIKVGLGGLKAVISNYIIGFLFFRSIAYFVILQKK